MFADVLLVLVLVLVRVLLVAVMTIIDTFFALRCSALSLLHSLRCHFHCCFGFEVTIVDAFAIVVICLTDNVLPGLTIGPCKHREEWGQDFS